MHQRCDPNQAEEISSSTGTVAATATKHCRDRKLHDDDCVLLGVLVISRNGEFIGTYLYRVGLEHHYRRSQALGVQSYLFSRLAQTQH